MNEGDEVVLVRHGETEWTRSGRHTGRTDIPLTERGREQAQRIGRVLRDRRFALVLASPLSRALETCRLAGFGEHAELTDDLLEWDYGDYEGLRTDDIRVTRPRWSLWSDGVPGGETADDVAAFSGKTGKMMAPADADVSGYRVGSVGGCS